MFQTARMRKLKIISLDKYSKPIVQALQEKGIVQIDDISERIQHDPEWANIYKPSKVSPLTGKLSSLLMKTTGLSELLGDSLSGEVGIKDMVKSLISPVIPEKIEVEDLSTEDLIAKAENLLEKVEPETKVIENKKNVMNSRRSELESNINVALKVAPLDVDLATLNDTKYISTIVGRMDVESANKFKEESSNITDKLLILEKPIETNDKSKSKNIVDELVVIVTLNRFKEEMNSLLRRFDFEKYEVAGLSGKSEDIIKSSESELESLEKDEEELNSQLKEIAEKWDDDILVLKEQLEIEKDRNEVFATFGKTDNTLLLEAWVPLKDLDETMSLIDHESEGHSVIDVEDIGEDDTGVPVLQDNPAIAKPYEYLVSMYAPPKYHEVDPTVIMCLFFPFMFGFCLTDSFYGIIFTLMGMIVVMGMGRVNKSFNSLGWIAIQCGLWGIFLGFVADGFLGDFTLRFFEIPLSTVLIDAFHLPHIVLVYAILVGIVQVNIGTILGVINKFRYGQKKEAIGGNIVWFILEAGIVFLALSFVIPGMETIGLILGGICIAATLGILVAVYGVFGMMDVFTFIGNILSYARLLAMCLSTAGIAITANILSQVTYDMVPHIGPEIGGFAVIAGVLAVIVFIFGHFLNYLIQIVGGFINTMRLHFVEFFNHFYTGAYNAFNPFSSNRALTKLKKEPE